MAVRQIEIGELVHIVLCKVQIRKDDISSRGLRPSLVIRPCIVIVEDAEELRNMLDPLVGYPDIRVHRSYGKAA